MSRSLRSRSLSHVSLRAAFGHGASLPRYTPPLFVLNFYSPVFIDQLKRGRKTATIRLGDKSMKYRRGQLVWITVGFRHEPREKVFTAVIDDVEVKRVARAVAARHRARQPRVPPRRGDASTSWSRSTAARSPHDDIVTVIRFSQVIEDTAAQRRGRPATGTAASPAC